jgi:adenylate cyclase
MFEKAIEVDPQYAQAYAMVSWTYWLEWFWYGGQDQTLERAFQLAQKAVALNDSLPVAHVGLGYVYLFKKQHEQAVAEVERAVAVDPNFPAGYSALADILCFVERGEESIGLIEKAMRLNPRYPAGYLATLGFAYLVTGRYGEAVDALKKALSRNPSFLGAHMMLAVVYSELGREEEARAALAAGLRLSPNLFLELVKQRLPFKDPAALERYLDGLRKAGLK